MAFRLLDVLFPPRSDEAVVRGICAEQFVALMTPVTVPKTTPETTALMPFHHELVRAVIHEAKYHGNAGAFSLLARTISDFLEEIEAPLSPAVLVPVPLSNKRRRARGYNQVEEVARRAAQTLNLRLENSLLERTRDTASQVALPAHLRIENMHDAFACSKGHTVSPETTYIVLDDVITIGATMQAAIDALTAAGATRIVPVALAH